MFHVDVLKYKTNKAFKQTKAAAVIWHFVFALLHCCAAALLHCCTAALLHCCTAALLHCCTLHWCALPAALPAALAAALPPYGQGGPISKNGTTGANNYPLKGGKYNNNPPLWP
jgi:hypothetical protein